MYRLFRQVAGVVEPLDGRVVSPLFETRCSGTGEPVIG